MDLLEQSLPSFSIVIPSRNRCALLRKTLETLFLADYPASRVELLVADDGSEDDTVRMLEEVQSPFSFRILRGQHRGPATSRNHALQHAKGDIVLFLDDDLIVPPQLLREHAKAHSAGADIVAFGPVRFHPQTRIGALGRWVADDHQLTLSRIQKGVRLPWEAALEANSSVRREHLLRVGGFDERFYLLWENREIGVRLAQAGLIFRYLPEAVVEHVVIKGVEDFFVRDAYWAGRNEVLFVQKHPGMKTFTSLIPAFFEGSWPAKQLKRLRWFFPRGWSLATQFGAGVGRSLASDTLQRFAWTQLFVGNYARGVRSILSSLGELRELVYREVPVLFYHNVGPSMPSIPPSMITPPVEFAKQIRYLRAQGFQSIGLDDWLNWIERGTPLPPRPVILNFDDAYEGVYLDALPVLEQYGMRASLFPIAGLVGATNLWDQARGWPAMRLMSVEQLREAARGGMEIGSHSLTHADLSQLSQSQLKEEISVSKSKLEDSLGLPIRWFCYPYGLLNESAREMVATSGYRGAVSTRPAKANPKSDPYALPRIMVNGAESLWSFRTKVRWASNPLETVQEIWKRKVAAWIRPLVHARAL